MPGDRVPLLGLLQAMPDQSPAAPLTGLPAAALDQPQVNMPFGELSVPHYTPSQRIGNAAQDALQWLGAQPHVARHLVEGLGGVLGLTPAAVPAAAMDAIDAQAHGDQAGAAAAMAGMIPGAGPIERKAADVVEPLVRGIRAFHGSPHDFDKFDLSKIGTGEGAQAYGHGLYFAGNEGVAKSYRDALAQSTVNGKNYDPYNPLHVAAAQVEESGSREAAIKEIEQAVANDPGDPSGHFPRVLSLLKSDRGLPKIETSGKMYEVNINADPEHFLDWDKPLSDQSPVVKEAASNIWGVPTEKMHDLQFVRKVAPDISEQLRSSGVPGIKYLDQGSRAAGEGSRNYVVFDDKLIDILRKYGLIGAIPTGAISAGLLAQPTDNQSAL